MREEDTARLFLLRHAKSRWDGQEGFEDAERPLSARGERAAAVMAVFLSQEALGIERVVCSTALRTRQTLERILPGLRPLPELRFEPSLYEAPAERLLEQVRRHGQGVQRLLVLGHNPGLEDLARLLCTGEGGAKGAALPPKFSTAALMEIALGDLTQARAGAGTLMRFEMPKRLV